MTFDSHDFDLFRSHTSKSPIHIHHNIILNKHASNIISIYMVRISCVIVLIQGLYLYGAVTVMIKHNKRIGFNSYIET